jgi:hypothetical protein
MDYLKKFHEYFYGTRGIPVNSVMEVCSVIGKTSKT